MGLKKLGLLGTRFLMQAKLYPEAFLRAGISIVIPQEDDQSYVQDKYVTELVNGILLPETQQGLLATVARMKSRSGIEGVILGGTELSLILGDVIDEEVVFLDTTRIHVDAAVSEILS
jgi:aspartate racemase